MIDACNIGGGNYVEKDCTSCKRFHKPRGAQIMSKVAAQMSFEMVVQSNLSLSRA